MVLDMRFVPSAGASKLFLTVSILSYIFFEVSKNLEGNYAVLLDSKYSNRTFIKRVTFSHSVVTILSFVLEKISVSLFPFIICHF